MSKSQTTGNNNPAVIIPFLQNLLGYHNVKQSEMNPDIVEITGFSSIDIAPGQALNFTALTYELNNSADIDPPIFKYMGIDSDGEKTNDERITVSLSALQRNMSQVFNLDSKKLKDAYVSYIIMLSTKNSEDVMKSSDDIANVAILERITGLEWESYEGVAKSKCATEEDAQITAEKLVGLDPYCDGNVIKLCNVFRLGECEIRKRIADNFGKGSLIKPPVNKTSTEKRNMLEDCTRYVWEDDTSNNEYVAHTKSSEDANNLAIGLRLESAKIAEANGLKAGFSVKVNEETNAVGVSKDSLEALVYMYKTHATALARIVRDAKKAKQDNDKGLG